MELSLEEQLVQSQQEREEYLNGWKRAKADFVNYQREQERLQRSIVEYANTRLLEELLPLYDSVAEGVRHSPPGVNDGWRELLKQFHSFLRSQGVEPIKTVGETVNPNYHEVVDTRMEEGIETGLIVAEVQTGFLLRGKALRASKVVVSC